MPRNQSNNLNQLGSILRKKIGVVRSQYNEIAKDIARQVMVDLTDNTIVDTSQALSNWVATLDQPHTGKIQAHFPGKKGSTLDKSTATTLKLAENVISQKKPGQPLFIVSSLQNDTHEFNAQVDLARQVAMDKAILAVAKAKVLVKDAK